MKRETSVKKNTEARKVYFRFPYFTHFFLLIKSIKSDAAIKIWIVWKEKLNK